jgi:hypothetical protein
VAGTHEDLHCEAREETTVNFLHYDLHLQAGDVVEITLDKQANVRLMDEANYTNYRQGQQHTYYGGRAVVSPIRIPAPHAGHFHLVVDLGGYAGSVMASVRTLQGAA